MGWRRVFLIALTAGIASACTPGAQSAPAASMQTRGNGTIVGVSLLKYGQTPSAFGVVAGYNPALVIVAHGTTIQFHNEDAFGHTASGISGTTFPGGNPLPISEQQPSGTDVSQAGWSSGLLGGGAFSRTFNTAQVGTYLFGCQIHYPSMRGVIFVQ